MDRKKRGRPAGPLPRAPNAEPIYLPDPKHLEFGRHTRCSWCGGKGKKRGNICGVCGGYGVIDEGPERHHPTR